MTDNQSKENLEEKDVSAEEKGQAENTAEETKDEAAEQAKEQEESDVTQEEVEAKKHETILDPTEEKKEESFDWETLEAEEDPYTQEEREKLVKMYDETFSSIAEHEVLDGTVVSVTKREIVVNIGYKSEGVIPRSEVRYNPDIKPGDDIEVYVESQEDKNGQLLLSHKKARILRSWERVNNAYDKDEVINGYIKCRTKGGLIVDVFGIEAFLPGSQIDVKPIRDYDIFVGKTMEFKVVKINHEYKNVVVSHKALIEEELEQQKAEIISKLEKGQILEGTVKNITSYGVFIDLGGVDGLIHITDLSWGRINHPEEIVELDQKINVVILDFDDDKKRIALGLKQLTPHPWDSLDPNLKIGDKVKGKVVVIADYGAFIEIAPGVEGLIHVSEMSWSQHLRTAQDFLKVGDEVEAIILTLDREERKMSLGMKQLIPDPWTEIEEKYPISSKHKATVRNFTNFGIFVELEEGVDGLIHISDLSWSKKIKHPAEFTQIGEAIEVVVLDIDKENRRLSLGHKQIEENPWDVFESIFTVNSIHKGTIVNTGDKGAIVTLPYGVEGFAPNRHLVKKDNSTVKMDEQTDFKVIEFSKEAKKIIVSHSRVWEDEERAKKDKESAEKRTQDNQARKQAKKLKDNLEKTTLGDIEALANLKSEMDETGTTKKKAAPAAKKEEPVMKEEEPKEEAKEEAKKEEAPEQEQPKAESKKEEGDSEEKEEDKQEEAPEQEQPKAESKKEEGDSEEKEEDKQEEAPEQEQPKAESKKEEGDSEEKKEEKKEE